MKVKELIELLDSMPQEALVDMMIPGDIYDAYGDISKVRLREDGCVELKHEYID